MRDCRYLMALPADLCTSVFFHFQRAGAFRNDRASRRVVKIQSYDAF